MPLSVEDRGRLDKIIDDVVQTMPLQVNVARSVKLEYLINEESDFAFGRAYGRIEGAFFMYFVAKHERSMTNEERDEMLNVMHKRAKEIKEAIFKTG